MVAVVALLALPCAARAQSTAPSPSELAAIAKAFPKAAVVTAADVSKEDCGPTPNPGFVEGDFNGDGQQDFAVLLNNGETGKVVDWQGKKLKETRYVFAIFVNKGDGTFVVRHVDRWVESGPLIALISPQPAGRIESFVDKSITISNPGVAFAWCGKSEAVYYMSANHVRSFWVSD